MYINHTHTHIYIYIHIVHIHIYIYILTIYNTYLRYSLVIERFAVRKGWKIAMFNEWTIWKWVMTAPTCSMLQPVHLFPKDDPIATCA